MPLKDRLREFHLHDNHGKSDEHLPIGTGTFPFRSLKQFVAHARDPCLSWNRTQSPRFRRVSRGQRSSSRNGVQNRDRVS